jgi:glutamate dehydrogenase (NADP+)
MDLKNERRGRIKEYVEKYPNAKYTAGTRGQASNPLWEVKCDVALPSATQNEINGRTPTTWSRTAATASPKGANMPTTPEA